MTPTVTSYVERVTIVLNPDGSVKGAMQESLQTIADTSVTPPTILQAQMLPAVPIAPATLAAVLPAQASALSQVSTLQQQVTTLTAELATATTSLATATSQLAAFQSQPAPGPACYLWQLETVMTPAQWSATAAAVAALNNPSVTAFFKSGTNLIPANSTTLQALGQAIGLTPAQVTALVVQASTINLS